MTNEPPVAADLPNSARLHAVLGIEVAGDDPAALVVDTDDRHGNTQGGVHGGVLATLLDAVMGRAVRAGLPPDRLPATVSMTVTYLAPAALGDRLYATAVVRKRGRRLVMVEADIVRSGDGVDIAHGVASYAVVAAP